MTECEEILRQTENEGRAVRQLLDRGETPKVVAYSLLNWAANVKAACDGET